MYLDSKFGLDVGFGFNLDAESVAGRAERTGKQPLEPKYESKNLRVRIIFPVQPVAFLACSGWREFGATQILKDQSWGMFFFWFFQRGLL